MRTADGRVELIGDISLHFGHQSHSVSTTPAGGREHRADHEQLPPQLRARPRPALLVPLALRGPGLTGFGGQAFFDIPVNGNPATGNNSQHGIFTSFGLLGVF